jgi:DNA anti-recombination protein RmuC
MINETWLAFGALALVAMLVLAIVTLVRLSALAREREFAGREAAELRARIDAYSQAAAEHERDMRTDLATARQEQGDAASALRREVGERLTQFQDGTQRSLADANTAQREQLRQFGERLGELTQTVERKLDGCATRTRRSSTKCAPPSTRSCSPRSRRGSANRSSRCPTGSSRCIVASARCRTSPSASAISSVCSAT